MIIPVLTGLIGSKFTCQNIERYFGKGKKEHPVFGRVERPCHLIMELSQMAYSLHLLNIIRNEDFKKIALFDRPKITFILFLSLISVMILAAFPLITQVFLVNVYVKKDINYLILITASFLALFIFKFLIDISIEKYRVKYFIKIEKNLRELIIKKYESHPERLFGKRSELYKKDIYLYSLLIRTVYWNFQDIARIFIVCIIIFIFDKILFLYFVFAMPVLLLFYFIGERISMLEGKDSYSNIESDFALMLKKGIDSNFDETNRRKFFMKCLEENMRKKIRNKNKYVYLNVLMFSFINFFRLFYLAYFGYYIIKYDLKIYGLIVGLLYITILLKPLANILKSIPNYRVCSKSYFRINSLLFKAAG